jgi:hypothetical protein
MKRKEKTDPDAMTQTGERRNDEGDLSVHSKIGPRQLSWAMKVRIMA